MIRFLIILTIIPTIAITLLGLRLTGIGQASWWIAASLVAGIMFFPLMWFATLPEALDTFLRYVVYVSMGLVSFLIGLIFIRDVIFVPLSFVRPEIAAQAFARNSTMGMFAVAFCMLVFAYWNATRGPNVVHVEIPIQNLPQELEKVTLAQISDLHAGPSVSKAFVDRVVAQTLALKPTAVLMTGDIADGNFEKFQGTVASFDQLSQAAPVFYVTGNHEYLKDGGAWIRRFKELGFKVLLNEHAVLSVDNKTILFAGVLDPQIAAVEANQRPDILQALQGAPKADIKVLLAHQPNIADEAAPFFQVQISGHTHRGQFFPWNLAIHLFQKYAGGLEKAGDMWVYVNQGTGYWGPPLRLGTRSEISLIKFVNAR